MLATFAFVSCLMTSNLCKAILIHHVSGLVGITKFRLLVSHERHIADLH